MRCYFVLLGAHGDVCVLVCVGALVHVMYGGGCAPVFVRACFNMCFMSVGFFVHSLTCVKFRLRIFVQIKFNEKHDDGIMTQTMRDYINLTSHIWKMRASA